MTDPRPDDDGDGVADDRSVEASFAGEATVTMLHGGLTGLVGGALLGIVGLVLTVWRRRRR